MAFIVQNWVEENISQENWLLFEKLKNSFSVPGPTEQCININIKMNINLCSLFDRDRR